MMTSTSRSKNAYKYIQQFICGVIYIIHSYKIECNIYMIFMTYRKTKISLDFKGVKHAFMCFLKFDMFSSGMFFNILNHFGYKLFSF